MILDQNAKLKYPEKKTLKAQWKKMLQKMYFSSWKWANYKCFFFKSKMFIFWMKGENRPCNLSNNPNWGSHKKTYCEQRYYRGLTLYKIFVVKRR